MLQAILSTGLLGFLAEMKPELMMTVPDDANVCSSLLQRSIDALNSLADISATKRLMVPPYQPPRKTPIRLRQELCSKTAMLQGGSLLIRLHPEDMISDRLGVHPLGKHIGDGAAPEPSTPAMVIKTEVCAQCRSLRLEQLHAGQELYSLPTPGPMPRTKHGHLLYGFLPTEGPIIARAINRLLFEEITRQPMNASSSFKKRRASS